MHARKLADRMHERGAVGAQAAPQEGVHYAQGWRATERIA
jgi:hypothetical protein